MIRLSPSRAGRWINCTASVSLEPKYPRPVGPAALKGTKAHHVAHQILTGKTPDTAEIESEMLDAINAYVSVALARYIKAERQEFARYEQKITRAYYNGKIVLSGTPDMFTYDPITECAYILDFKTGLGPVEAIENWQLLIYADLVSSTLPTPPKNYDMIIVQPQAHHKDGPVRSWKISAEEIKQYQARLGITIRALSNQKYIAHVGPWCRYCNALHSCVTAQRAAAESMDITGEALVFELTPAQLSAELNRTEEALQILTQRLESLKELIQSKIRNGTTVPGWEISLGPGSTQWNRPVSDIIGMADMLGVNVRKSMDVITPRQAEIAGLDPAVVKQYTYTRKGASKLKRSDPNLGKKVFGKKD